MKVEYETQIPLFLDMNHRINAYDACYRYSESYLEKHEMRDKRAVLIQVEYGRMEGQDSMNLITDTVVQQHYVKHIPEGIAFMYFPAGA